MAIDEVQCIRHGRKINMDFKIINSRQIVSDYVTNGYEGIEKYSNYLNLCIDDLGNEVTEAKHYGTKLNCIEEIIENRYIKGHITHITTNFKIESIPEIYSDRVHSRLKEMCNYEIFKGEDLRISNNMKIVA